MTPKRVLDIGANIGEWAKLASQAWPTASFHLIEANPGCKQYLDDLPWPYTIALLGDSERDSVPFYTISTTATGASVYRELTWLYDACEPIWLPQTTLDALFPMSVFEFVKIDTQGSELDIMRGGMDLIQRGTRAILMEVSLEPYNEGAPLHDEVVEFMKGIGFPFHKSLGDPGPGQKDICFARRRVDLSEIR
jgi:FkbM family methyltransferase